MKRRIATDPGTARVVVSMSLAAAVVAFAAGCAAAETATQSVHSATPGRGAAAFATMPPARLGAPLPPPSSGAVAAATLDDRDLRAYLARVRPLVLRAGVSAATFERATRDIKIAPSVLGRVDAQPELVRSTANYIQALVGETRIAEGRKLLREQAPLLSRIEQAYGVPAAVLVAIWGIESRYGAHRGTVPILDGLTTLAASGGRRQAFWQQQLIAALRIVERGDLPLDALVGSWAGALGHTQFIPTTYLARAVDFDGDGRRDMVASPADALASAAHHLRASGWIAGAPWGFEVRLPKGFDYAFSAPGRAKPVEVWDQLKVHRADGENLPRRTGDLQLVLPAGAGGPAFLVTSNYRAILAYNNAMAYAVSVGLLADRIGGQPDLVTPWPPSDAALDRVERVEVQRTLMRLGYEPGDVDGVLGRQTRDAIRAYQLQAGRAADGHPDRALLDQLRVDSAETIDSP